MDKESQMGPEWLKKHFNLEPLPFEGGFFCKRFESRHQITEANGGQRPATSSIFYLLEGQEYSAWHKVDADECFHYYHGNSAVELFVISPKGTLERHLLGKKYDQGELPHQWVPRGSWQASRCLDSQAWALLGCTVAPAYRQDGFSLGDIQEIKKLSKGNDELIEALAPK